MAINRKYATGDSFSVPVASGVVSGQAVAVGQLPGVALIDRQSDGEATVQFNGVFDLIVEGKNSGGNSAVAAGDIVYLQNDGTLSINNAGKRFGYALGAVLSGNTTTKIPVKIGY